MHKENYAIWRKFYVKMLSKLKIVYRNYLQCSNSGSKLCTLDCYQQTSSKIKLGFQSHIKSSKTSV